MSVAVVSGAGDGARRPQEAGGSGITFTDSQNRCPDPFVVFATVAVDTEWLTVAIPPQFLAAFSVAAIGIYFFPANGQPRTGCSCDRWLPSWGVPNEPC